MATTLSKLAPSRTAPGAITTPLRVILATTAALWMGQAIAQTSSVAGTRPVTELRFGEFFRAPVGGRGVEMSDTLKKADGQTVRLTGYMVQQDRPPLGRFMLTPRPVQMSEHADGDADDLPVSTVAVYLDDNQQDFAIPYVRGLVQIVGQLHVGRFEEKSGRVFWLRLQLDDKATQGMTPLQMAAYLHSLQHPH